ncbi:DUF3606 domain-containing protein [Cupriavidus necator]|uniref:DUF3606 domain-containing protein n=1 Tax=Cupriavidus necator TaxID=106590 RepID=UPI0005B48AA1|nr:DUF3606 domain-containing protein [Cupriavidus necator]
MIDATSQFRPLDPGRVNLMDPLEVQYWCHELGCSQDDLEHAVDAAGDHIAAVRAQLEENPAYQARMRPH